MRAGIHWKVSNGRCATEFRNIIIKSEDPKLTIPSRHQRAEIKMANCPPGRMQAKKRIAVWVTQPRIFVFRTRDGNFSLNRLGQRKLFDSSISDRSVDLDQYILCAL